MLLVLRCAAARPMRARLRRGHGRKRGAARAISACRICAAGAAVGHGQAGVIFYLRYHGVPVV